MSLKIKAAVLRAAKMPLTIEELLLDDPRPDEVLIEVRAAGLCHSDLHSIDGLLPRELPSVIGHEAAGIVVAVGDKVRTLVPGDHVIPLFNPECRECVNCTSGKTNVCIQFNALNDRGPRLKTLTGEPVHRTSLGTTATHALLPESFAVKVDLVADAAWFSQQPEVYRNDWLRYAWSWVRAHDAEGYVQMPGLRIISGAVDGKRWYDVNQPSTATPNGFGQEQTIRAIWAADHRRRENSKLGK